MAMANTSTDGKLITRGAIGSPIRILARWNVSVRCWWVDHCAREGLLQAEDHILHEAGYRRVDSGRLVSLRLR